MTDFFISYTSSDEQWAEWIAYALEDAGYSTIIQAWDFRPGSNFVVEMQNAAKSANRTIMVLSPAYLKSRFANPEWASAFADDPQGISRKLIPVMVVDCSPDGMLAPLVHIKLVGLEQAEARSVLLAGVKSERAKPGSRPAFPGVATNEKNFPGSTAAPISQPAAPYLPKVKGKLSDIEKRRFLKEGFATIRSYFEHALSALASSTRGLEFEFQPISAVEFSADIFLNGKTVASCLIKYGNDMLSRDSITYAEGRGTIVSGSVNEILSVNNVEGEPAFSSMMGQGFGRGEKFNHKQMNPQQAAEFLWRRFVERLS